MRVVSLLTPSPGNPGANDRISGVHEGVPFEFACGPRTRARSFLGRRLLEAKVPLGLSRAAVRLFRGDAGPGAIIAHTHQPAWLVFMAVLAKLLGAKCIVELCELPFVRERPSASRAVRLWLQDALAYRMVDGFIAISTNLEEYATVHSHGRSCIIRVPILVAVDEFDVGGARAGAGTVREIVYLGDLGHEGEISDLLDAFSLVAALHEDVRLQLVGDAQPERRARIAARVTELGLDQRVVFVGAVQQSELPAILGKATAHVLLRRDAAFSQAGFPTKLGEYLASGRPVVVTTTGDIRAYLTDGVDAYLVPPGDPPRFAEQLRHVLDHEDEARQVGAHGRALVARRFDYRRHGKRLNAFIRSL